MRPGFMHAFWRLLPGAVLATSSLGCPWRTIETKPVTEGIISSGQVAIWERDSGFRLEAGKPFTTPFYAQNCVHTATVQNYSTALRWGARPVVVQVPWLKQPLYGLLAFCKVPTAATGPASRAYNVTVPQSYVDATEGQRVSVVYEPTDFENFPAWQLWLSRSPSLWQ